MIRVERCRPVQRCGEWPCQECRLVIHLIWNGREFITHAQVQSQPRHDPEIVLKIRTEESRADTTNGLCSRVRELHGPSSGLKKRVETIKSVISTDAVV